MTTHNTEALPSFKDFINAFKQTLKSVFYERDDIKKFIHNRGFPATVLRDIMSTNPFSVAIPQKYGGRGGNTRELLSLMDAASYESLPLSLMFGINMGLFLGPVNKYAQEPIKGEIFNRFLNKQNMGGLMITEPGFGSDALNMQTNNLRQGSKYHIKGVKHWQGLTGMADYWLMTSRRQIAGGALARDIDFFIVDAQQPEQQIKVDELYNNMGLYPIPYGKNLIDIHVPEAYKLEPDTTGLKLTMDLLHRSRFQFPGMAIGFIRRMLDDALHHTQQRFIRGKPLIALDQVKQQVASIQSAFTISSAMCTRSSEASGIEHNLTGATVEANTMKAHVTELMHEAAQTLTQLLGANGYKTESVAIRGIIDSRPFQVFEGSNEMLYTQITEMVTRQMNRLKNMNLASFLKNYELTQRTSSHFKGLTNFTIDENLPQRKQVGLGKILSRIISADYVATLGNKGFRNDLVNNSIDMIKQEVSGLVNSFHYSKQVHPVTDYNGKSSWADYS